VNVWDYGQLPARDQRWANTHIRRSVQSGKVDLQQTMGDLIDVGFVDFVDENIRVLPTKFVEPSFGSSCVASIIQDKKSFWSSIYRQLFVAKYDSNDDLQFSLGSPCHTSLSTLVVDLSPER
jgi:hypothetical protein